MGLFSGFSRIIGGIRMSIEAPLLIPFRDKADKLRDISPQFRMFLDSDLGSSIEAATKKMWADSMVTSIRDILPDGKISTAIANVWGNTIGDKAGRIMDKKKLKYHYKKGWITVDEYAEKRANQIQANLINRLKRPIANARELMNQVGLSEVVDKVDEFVKPIKDTVKEVFGPVASNISQKSRNLMQKGIATFHRGVNELREIREEYVKPVIEKTAKVIKTAATVVYDFGKATVDKVIVVTNKVWKWITG